MNDDVQVKQFGNERLRPACDQAISAIRTLRQLVQEYADKGIGPLCAGTQQLSDAVINDGAATDGRTPIKGWDLAEAIDKATALLAAVDANGGVILQRLTKPSVNGRPLF